MSRSQYRAHLAQQAAERILGLLDLELRLGTARRHLDVMVEYAAVLIDQCAPSLRTSAYREQLAETEQRILARGRSRGAAVRAPKRAAAVTPPETPTETRPSSPPSLRIVKP